MKMTDLFREVWLELHPDLNDEEYFKYADTVVPSIKDREIPDDQVELLRKEYLEIGRMIDSQSDEENNRHLNKFLSNN